MFDVFFVDVVVIVVVAVVLVVVVVVDIICRLPDLKNAFLLDLNRMNSLFIPFFPS